MCPKIFLALFLSLLRSEYSCTSGRELVSNLGDLLRTSECDVQIIHFGKLSQKFSVSDLNKVLTTMFMPKYKLEGLVDSKVLPALDVLNLRVSSCRLSFILLPADNKNAFQSVSHLKLIQIATEYHLYYRDMEELYPTKFEPNTNAVINLLTDIPKAKFLLPNQLYDPPMFYYLFIIFAGQYFELCSPQIFEPLFYENTSSDCIFQIYLSAGDFAFMVSKLGLQYEKWKA